MNGAPPSQGAGLLHQNRQIVPGLIDDLVPPEVPQVVGNHFVVKEHHDAFCMRTHQHHLAGGAGIDAVAVMIGHDQTGGGGTHGLLDKAVERSAQAHQACLFVLEHIPDRPVPELGMPGPLGVGDALILEPCVELGQAGHPRLGEEELVAQVADLVLHLTVMPFGHGLRLSHPEAGEQATGSTR